MANLPISRLVSGTQASDGDKFVYVQQGITKQIDYGDFQSSATSNVDYIDFNTSSINESKPGRLKWNDVDGTLDLTLKNGNVILQIGQEEVAHVYNNTTASFLESEHKAVYISGSTSEFPAVELADNLTRFASENTLGIVTEDIASGETGYVTTRGMVRNIDMSAYTAGDTLYLGSSDGVLINQPPLPPALTVIMGYCIDPSPTTGSMYVNVRSGFEYPQYAVAYNSVDHTASVNTETLIDFDTPSVTNGISFSNNTRFTVSTPGLYEFIVTSQIERIANSGSDKVYFWLKKNGSNVPDTTSTVSVVGNANTAADIITKNFVIVLEANDYVEFAWAVTTADIVLKAFPTGSNPTRPATPSAKVTATRIS